MVLNVICKIIHRLTHLLLIIRHYCTYINVFILVHLSVFESASDRFNVSPPHTDEEHRSAQKLCVLTCVYKN